MPKGRSGCIRRGMDKLTGSVVEREQPHSGSQWHRVKVHVRSKWGAILTLIQHPCLDSTSLPWWGSILALIQHPCLDEDPSLPWFNILALIQHPCLDEDPSLPWFNETFAKENLFGIVCNKLHETRAATNCMYLRMLFENNFGPSVLVPSWSKGPFSLAWACSPVLKKQGEK